MNVRLPFPPRRPESRAFTLIELLAVLAIIAILTALTVPAIAPILRSSNINAAAEIITDQLDLARQVTLTQNRDVEIRFYQLGAKTNPADVQFRAFRCFYADTTDPAQAQPISKMIYLPEPVIISADPTQSTLLDYSNASRSGLTRAQENLPVGGPTYYVSFMFRPTGGTNLSPIDPPTGNWYLTLYLENAPINASTHLPANYFTAQIDPVTGHVRAYRP